MSRLLTLSRAARLVGVSRGTLQKKIRDGELPAFEGFVDVGDLAKAFPDTHLEDSNALERFKQIKDTAYATRQRERLMPNAGVVAARLALLGKEHAETKAALVHYQGIVEALKSKLMELGKAAGPEANTVLTRLQAWLTEQLRQPRETADATGEVILKDNVLRIMAAHVKVLPSGHEFFVEGSDSILDAALRAGLAPDYGCSSGTCGMCKARVVSGEVMKIRPHDFVIPEAERLAGNVLLCCHTPVADLVVEAHEAGGAHDIPLQNISTRIKRTERLSDDTMLLHLQTPRTNRLRFLAGQSVTLRSPDGASSNFAVASCPCDDRNIQFHIRRQDNVSFTDYVFNRLKPSDAVALEGPMGDFILDDDSSRSLIFIAYDTGFAPIKSLIEHAMSLDQADRMHLYWVAPAGQSHYMNNLCRSWADALDNFQYTELTLASAGAPSELLRDELADIAGEFSDLANFDVYVAGPAALGEAASSAFFARGLPHGQLKAAETSH